MFDAGLQLYMARVRFLLSRKGQPMRERRKEQRWPAYIGGRASFFCEQSSADVLIRNTSASGARLVVHDGRFIPDNFNLTILKRQAEYRVRARWRNGDAIGIEFEQVNAKDMPALLALKRRSKQLEAKNLQLKHRIAELIE
jgi:hypothetical protein